MASQRPKPARPHPARKHHPLELSVLRFLRRHSMLKAGEQVLVAVSGGADSTGLLLCLHHLAPALGVAVSAAHLNHGIRADQADEDEKFVREFCAELSVPFVSEALDVKKEAAAHKENLEEAAREARYRFFRRMADRLGAHKIALGHTLNDQAETVLMRLIRGSGNDGIAAMRPVREGLFIRPLLETSRPEIVAYLKDSGISYREDSTNSDLRLDRNRVRHELVPYLRDHFNPKVVEALVQHARTAQEIADYLELQTRTAFEETRISTPGGLALSVDRLRRLHPALQTSLLRHVLRSCLGSLRGIGARPIRDLLSLCEPGRSGRRVTLPGRMVAVRQFDSLLFLDAEGGAATGFSYELPVPGRIHVPEIGMEFRALVQAREELPGEPEISANRVYLDADALPDCLVVRSRRPGDHYGSSSRKKVKKMLIDARIPLQARAALPLVVSGDVVLWIPGFPPASLASVRPKTERCVILEVTRNTS